MTSPNFPAANLVEVIADLRRRLEVLERAPRARSKPEFHSDVMAVGESIDMDSVESQLPYETYATVTLTVPVWAETATILAMANVSGTNGDAANWDHVLYGKLVIDGVESALSAEFLPAIDRGNVTNLHTLDLDVSAKSSITITAQAQRDNRAVAPVQNSTFLSSGGLHVLVVWSDE